MIPWNRMCVWSQSLSRKIGRVQRTVLARRSWSSSPTYYFIKLSMVCFNYGISRPLHRKLLDNRYALLKATVRTYTSTVSSPQSPDNLSLSSSKRLLRSGMSSESTIFAVSTPQGRAALAIIRISGPRATDVNNPLPAFDPSYFVVHYFSFSSIHFTVRRSLS
jgi:hypothetical protein